MDQLHELRTFIAVVEAGGFSAAARRARASQPAVSKAVGALEKRLGVMLFNRSTRNVTLTDQGQGYYDRTKLLVQEIDEVDSEFTSQELEISGSIRIAVASTFGRLHILPLIPDLLLLYPKLQVKLVLSDLARDMVDDRIDLAVRVGRVDELDAVAKRVAVTPLVCAGSRSYFERHGTPKTPIELQNHNCLLYDGLLEAENWPFVGPEGRFSVSVRGNLSSNSIEAIRAGVLAGVGIGLFARVSLAEELQHPDVITVLHKFLHDVRDISLVWPNRRFVPARVRRVTEFFAQQLARRI